MRASRTERVARSDWVNVRHVERLAQDIIARFNVRGGGARSDRPGGAVLGEGHDGLARLSQLVGEPRALGSEHQAGILRQLGALQGDRTGHVIDPDARDVVVGQPLSERRHRLVVVHV